MTIPFKLNFLLWSRGGWKITIGGPRPIGEHVRQTYSQTGARTFDCDLMEIAYGKKFQEVVTPPEKIPARSDGEVPSGGHLDGCRIGFDHGASDYKVAAVIDGEAVFTEETPWDPKTRSNPDYHYHHLSAALHRVDAIGVYLGYTLAHYADFYDFSHSLVLGRVTTGQGGSIVIDRVREITRSGVRKARRKMAFHGMLKCFGSHVRKKLNQRPGNH